MEKTATAAAENYKSTWEWKQSLAWKRALANYKTDTKREKEIKKTKPSRVESSQTNRLDI